MDLYDNDTEFTSHIDHHSDVGVWIIVSSPSCVTQLIEYERKDPRHQRRVDYTLWNALMKTVFTVDGLGCPFYGSGMSILSCIDDDQVDVLECRVEYDAKHRESF